MTEQDREWIINDIWDQIINLQKMACNGELCLLDKLRFNDLKDQLKQLGESIE